ncbi:MAG: alpha/beta hydrolase [Planctomycetota bacterium]|nr:MAG: alpha/beta hydrolase [Planctomycetota bacterium]
MAVIWFLSLAALYLGICVLLLLLQGRLIFVPFADHEIVDLPHDDVWLEVEDGTRIHAWWLEAPGAENVVLFCHGNAGNISHRQESLRFWRELGYSLLIFDYPGYGHSEGSPSEAGVFASARSAWNWLQTERKLPPERILVFGRSLGGAVATRLAHELVVGGKRPKGLIIESSFPSMVAVAQGRFPWLPVRLLLRHPFDNREYLKALDLPTLVIHSREDDIVAFRYGEEIYRLLPGPKEFVQIAGPHNGGWAQDYSAYRRGLKRWLNTLK